MKRARIIAKGDVQGVGYRGIVRKIAIKLNIVGRVGNVKPYDVRIIAEGEEENLKKFIEKIRIEEPPVDVEDLDTKWEEPTGEYDTFEVERGDLGEELGERLDIASGVMNKMVEKQDETIEVLGKKIDSGFGKTDKNFTTLRQDYGKISKTMEKILESMDKTSKKTEKVLEVLTRQQKDFNKSIDKLAGAILALAKKKS